MFREPSPERGSSRELSGHLTFEQSARQLLALANAEPTDNPGYIAVSPDTKGPPQLQEYEALTITPTGARRELRYGEFFQAQLRITSEDGTDTLVWCTTEASQVDAPTQINNQVLWDEFNLVPLTKGNAALELGRKASNVDEYNALLCLMQEHDVLIPRDLIISVRSTLRKAALPAALQGEKPDLQKIFSFITLYAEMNRYLPHGLQSELAQILLRQAGEVQRWGYESSETSKEAGDYLLLALSQEVITNSPVIRRILTNPDVYQFDFASEILNIYLHDPTTRRREGWIFSTRELSFIRDYTEVLLKTHTPEYPQGEIAQLYGIIQRIPDYVSLFDTEARESLKNDLEALLVRFPDAFRTICDVQPKADLVAKNVDTILRAILVSTQIRGIGRGLE